MRPCGSWARPPNDPGAPAWLARTRAQRQGAQPIHARLHTQYPGVYQNVGTFGNGGNGSAIATSTALQAFSAPTDWDGFAELWDALPEGLGGWTLDIHHTYDVTGHIVRLGNGSNRSFLDVPLTIQTVAGNGASSGSTARGPAASPATAARPCWRL